MITRGSTRADSTRACAAARRGQDIVQRPGRTQRPAEAAPSVLLMLVKTEVNSPPRSVNAPAAAITTSAPTSAYSTVDWAAAARPSDSIPRRTYTFMFAPPGQLCSIQRIAVVLSFALVL